MKDLIQNKLERYACKTEEEEENAIKEIAQEMILYALSKNNFFEKVAFQGGTCLRIVHGIDRFSEDLDFALHKLEPSFDLEPYLEKVSAFLTDYGFQLTRSGAGKGNVQKRFLKGDSLKTLLNLKHLSDLKKKINIKVEVDLNPPVNVMNSEEFLDFPTDYMITAHDLPSLCAGKCHALLCRSYTKGRDWYDFSWYGSRKITPNYKMLEAALDQMGPWKGQQLKVNCTWLNKHLNQRIEEIDWNAAKRDVERFITPDNLEVLKFWGASFFKKKLSQIV